MRKRRLTDEQILHAQRESESGASVAAICRQHGISHQTFDAWRNKCVQELPEFAELQQLREENAKPRSVVVKLNTDRQILKGVLARRPSNLGRVSN
jgi:putative transposase